jgi:hypothetical protein
MKASPVSSYLIPQARSTFSLFFPSLPAARLLGIELEISQLPLATPSNSGKLPFFRYLYPVPFNCISHAEPPRHDNLLSCALEQRARPHQDLAVCDLNSDEQSADNQITSRSTASPLSAPRSSASPGKEIQAQNHLSSLSPSCPSRAIDSSRAPPLLQETLEYLTSPSSSPRRPAHCPLLHGCQGPQRRHRGQPPVCKLAGDDETLDPR